MTHSQLLKLGRDWVDSTGGEFKGDIDCGCEPAHFALQASLRNELNMGPVQYLNVMKPVVVPITFADDGTFAGDGTADL